jgi:hypothetical protein
MAVAPFEQTCAGCHLNQITGKERVSGPKGIAFLTLPGLDLQTLKKKKVSIGEWPEGSEGELTPFMKVMISRSERGRALVNTVNNLNLQDLSRASDAQIRAVTALVWEIKRLFYELITGKASDVLAGLDIGGKAKLDAGLVADLTASIPRDVVIGAQQQWLPNLAAEMANRPAPGSSSPQMQSGLDAGQANSKRSLGREASQSDGSAGRGDAPKADDPQERPSAERSSSTLTPPSAKASEPPDKRSSTDTPEANPGPRPESATSERAGKPRPDPQACIMDVFGQCLLSKAAEPAAAKSDGASGQTDAANPDPEGEKERPSAQKLPRAMQAALKDAGQTSGAAGSKKPANTLADRSKEPLSVAEAPRSRAPDQTDDLLNLTEEELRGIGARIRDAGKVQPEAADRKTDAANTALAASDKALSEPPARAAPAFSLKSDVDPESWADYGGWYRQDYAIFYRPTGHKDRFIYTWLFLTGSQAPKGATSPAAAVFDFLTTKDAPGSCTKCHSVDVQGKGRVVNFSASSVESKQGRFTSFIHEPHFGVLDQRGCLTCHQLEKGSPFLKSYEQGNPQNFASNFGAVKKELCQSCHTSSMARQDCLLCHKYHVNGVVTPIMNTRIPNE